MNNLDKIDIDSIDFNKIRLNTELNGIDQIKKLQNCIEDNPWHKREAVLNHTYRVIDNILRFVKNFPKSLYDYFNDEINGISKKQILLTAALLHDVGKVTKNQDHNKSGKIIASRILKDYFVVNSIVEKRILYIIANHSVIHSVLDDMSISEKKYNHLKNNLEDIYWELLVLGYADVLAMKEAMKEYNNRDYEFRNKFISKQLGLDS